MSTVMVENERNRWGWDEAEKVQRCATVCADAADVLDGAAIMLGATKSQVDAEALHFVAMLIFRYGRPDEALAHLLERVRDAMEECEK